MAKRGKHGGHKRFILAKPTKQEIARAVRAAVALRTMNTLIRYSIEHNSIAHAPHTAELEAELLAASEDSVRDNNIYEFWGTDYGRSWRVHLDMSRD